jgi:hypothetical protein
MLHCVCDKCKNEYGALVEWYWQVKQTYSYKILSQCCFVHHKSEIYQPGIEALPLHYEDGD